MSEIGILLLAAGSSQRMGSPKQLLDYKGQTLIEHTLQVMLKHGVASCTVVLGANAKRIQTQCDLAAADYIVNPTWEMGMGNSIAFGMRYLITNQPKLGHIMIALVDQPHILTEDYAKLIEASHIEPEKIIASYYDDHAGAPMVFPSSYFKRLAALDGDEGARRIVRNELKNVVKIAMPQAALDWDRPEDVSA